MRTFCGASKAERHLGNILSVVRPSVCPSVCHTFCLLITFLLWKIMLTYLACVFLMTRHFRWNHVFWARDLNRDLWPIFGKLCLSHFWFVYNFFTVRDKAFIFGIRVPYDKTFPMVTSILITWPWPWPLTYMWKTFTLNIKFSYH